MYMITETLCQTRQQIQSDDDERPIRLLEAGRILLVLLELLEARLYDCQTTLVDRLGVGGECRSSGDGY